ncbi:MAG: COR domain-containing protein [Bacteroidota bacterium]
MTAEEIIQKEREERTGFLDIGNCGLTELPDLSDMDWLETLVVSNKGAYSARAKWGRKPNKGTRNTFFKKPVHPLPASIKRLYFAGVIQKKWQASDFGFLKNLTQLIILDLSENRILDASFLKKLNQLTSLNLSHNNISDTFFLVKLTQLRSLYLSQNNISNSNFLKSLTGRTISHHLKKLSKLESLDLSFNQISNISFTENHRNLTSLNLWNNQISDISFIENLTNLTSLNLRDNKISDISFDENLTNLTSFNLGSNQISDVSFIETLSNLTYLDLHDNHISNISFIKNLTNLTSLYLGNNQISDFSPLENLPKLKILFLYSSQISNVNFLEKLTGLETLYLNQNQIMDASSLGKLTGLTSLFLESNQISDVSFLKKLIRLNSLGLDNNQISDISFLKQLSKLTEIRLAKNQLTDLAPLLHFMKEKNMNVIWEESYHTHHGSINVRDNPIEHPPIEVVKKGNAAILEYFRQKEKTGAAPLREAKLILLGDGRSGKTSLARRLLKKELPKEEDRTLGVDILIDEYTFPMPEGPEFKLHIWDFAGQDKYKPLHQFFYTEDAVYVMVADSGNPGTDYDDWLQSAELFGENSPLLLALNEFRDGIGMGTFDEEHWKKRFPKLLKEVFLVNLLKMDKQFEDLQKTIHFQAQLLPHTKQEYPNNWAAVRQELERRRNENFISFQEFLNICKANDLPEKQSALILSSVLHKIGVCLHYQQSDLLRQYVILKNEWATQAVYQILEDRIVTEEKKGFFDKADLRRIWSSNEYSEMRPQLLELMRQFKMAYPLPNQQEFITPLLLPLAPAKDWKMPAEASLELYFEYELMPKLLMTQFIVTRHTDIDRGRTLVWRNGVVLRWPDALAEVTKTKSRGRDAFYIRSQGSNRRGLLTAILKTFRDLHSEYKGIKVSEIVPCPCEGCRTEKNKQHYFEFENLKNRIEKGRRIVECDKSLEEVELVRLLGNYFTFDQLTVGQPVVMQDAKKPASPKKTIRIFLASSAELSDEREKLRQYISERNDLSQENDLGYYLKLENWETMSAAMSTDRKQDDYNERIKVCDVFICLVHTKVGKYTEEEFDFAWSLFQKTTKPLILTYFKKDKIDPDVVQPTRAAFKKKLEKALNHFPDHYTGFAELEGKVSKEIERLLLE